MVVIVVIVVVIVVAVIVVRLQTYSPHRRAHSQKGNVHFGEGGVGPHCGLVVDVASLGWGR